MARIAIIGLGLIGGSLGLALMRLGRRDLEIIGFDTDPAANRAARDLQAVQETARSVGEAVQGAGLVVVAVPATAVEEVFQAIAPFLAHGAAVTDTASTKGQIMRWAQEHLPPGVSFVGGHPMAGKSDAGILHAEATLFQDCPYAVVPSANASDAAVTSVVSMAEGLGAKVTFIDAEEHDRIVGGISHLPLLLSVALFRLIRHSPGYPDLARLAGPAFRDLTRLASGDPHMSTGIAVTNRENMQQWLDRFILELHQIRALLEESPETLLEEFARMQFNRERFLSGADQERGLPLEVPDLEDHFVAALAGAGTVSRLQRFWRAQRERENRLAEDLSGEDRPARRRE